MNIQLFTEKEKKYELQTAHFSKCTQIIPSGSSTVSKNPVRFPVGEYPIYIQKAKGNYLYDLDGNKYLDWTSGLGTNILSYSHPAINRAIKEQLEYGINYSYSSELEYILAKQIIQLISPAEMVKFFKSGSDSCNAAIRVARAFTGKNDVLVSKSCYHGNGDWFAYSMDYHNGIPMNGNLCYFEYHNIDSVRQIISENQDIAAIILEPAITNIPDSDFLYELQEICIHAGILIIYDEMVTGLRSPDYSVQNYINTTPDLSCFGKALGNGMPISALVGREDIMELFDVDHSKTPVFYSGTYFGECLSMASAIATLKIIQKRNSYYLSILGKILKSISNTYDWFSGEVKSDSYKPNNYRISTTLSGQGLLYKSVFLQELAKKEVLIGNIIYPNFAHTEKEAKYTADSIKEVWDELAGLNNTELKNMLKGQQVQDFNLRKQ